MVGSDTAVATAVVLFVASVVGSDTSVATGVVLFVASVVGSDTAVATGVVLFVASVVGSDAVRCFGGWFCFFIITIGVSELVVDAVASCCCDIFGISGSSGMSSRKLSSSNLNYSVLKLSMSLRYFGNELYDRGPNTVIAFS